MDVINPPVPVQRTGTPIKSKL